MTLKEIAIGAGVLVLLGGIAGYVHERELRIRAEVVQQTQQQVAGDAQKQIDVAKQAQKQTDSDLKQQLAIIAAQRQTVPTPQQVVVDVSKLIPTLPTPLQVQSVPATATTPATEQVVIPKEDIPALHNYKLNCDQGAAELNACKLTTANLEMQLDATKVELQATTKERDTWKVAAKGGTKWTRTKTALKWIAIGAAAGYAAHR